MKRKFLLLSAVFAIAFLAGMACMQLTSDKPLFSPPWVTICDDAVATVYHAVPEECNADVTHTASMRVIDPAGDVAAYRIVAMERTMMAEYGISYGDQVLIQGTGDLDGLWTVEDTMNKRFAGQHRIDFLVPTSRKGGLWHGVSVKVPKKRHRRMATANMTAKL